MSAATEELTSRKKLAKLLAALRENLAEECIEAILQSPGDINYSLPPSEHLKLLNASVRTGTILHHVTGNLTTTRVAKIIKLLLRHGADITKKNSDGRTALHAAVLHCFEDPRYDYQIIEAILTAHVEHSIRENPRDDSNGISHFHAACMKNHVTAVGFFLENGVDVDEAIYRDSKSFAGCTPLLLAVHHSCLETAKQLIEYGADVRLEDAEGFNPLQVLVKKNLKIVRCKTYGVLEKDYRVNEKMIRLLLTSEHFSRDNATRIVANEYGFTNLHAACAVGEVSPANDLLKYVEDIDQTISADSPFCPGYTTSHFAAHFNVDIVKLLQKRGGNLLARDVSGVTPLDICAQRNDIYDLVYILSREPALRDVTFSDGKTKLLDLFRAMQSKPSCEQFLGEIEDIDCHLDEGSPLWPGYTPLHFAVLLFEEVKWQSEPGDRDETMVGLCLDRGARCRGSSPLHLAFHLQRRAAISEIFACSRELTDWTDENNVSHLFIACTADDDDDQDEHPVRRLVRVGAIVNLATTSSVEFAGKRFPAKSTPLHMLVAENKPNAARFLLEHGADPNASDEAGWSPLHRLMVPESYSSSYQQGVFYHMTFSEKMVEVLFSFADKLRDRVVEATGLSHLHVACRFGNLAAVERLLEAGSDANAALECHLPLGADQSNSCAGYRPLHFAVRKHDSLDIVRALLRAGADVFAPNAAGVSPLCQVLASSSPNRCAAVFAAHLRNSEDLQRRLENASGMTMLHILVFVMDVEAVERSIAAGADVNAKMHPTSPIWPGCTPLHAWFYGWRDGCGPRAEVATGTLSALLRAGADVALPDSQTYTPLLCYNRGFMHHDFAREGFTSMLKHQKDFRVNPSTARGFSHFHMSVVLEDLAAAEEFLKNGVDVDQRVDVLSEIYPGCSSLHLLAHSQSTFCSDKSLSARTRMLELLLRHGADVHARDVRGNTPLHALARDTECFEMLVRAGATIHSTNHAGQTPFAAAIGVLSVEQCEFYLRQGYRLNAFNELDRTGFLATALVCSTFHEVQLKEKMRLFLGNPDVKSVDDDGRTAIHNIVSTTHQLFRMYNYSHYIGELVNLGCDIDAQDRTGKTALHTAALFGNGSTVEALLSSGADVNVVDANGKLAFDYVWDAYQREVGHLDAIRGMAEHVQKMLFAQLHVCQRNRELTNETMKMKDWKQISRWKNVLPEFREQLEDTRRIGIADADPLRLYDLISETGVVAAYPTMPLSKRLAVDRFFNGENAWKWKWLSHVADLLVMQYNKMIKRAGMVESAHCSWRILSGIPLPELVCEQLTRYLGFCDVQNLVGATEKYSRDF